MNINTSLRSIDAQLDRAEIQITKSQKILNEEILSHKRFINMDADGLRFYSDHIHYLIKKL